MTNQSIKENLKNEKSKSPIDEPNIKKTKSFIGEKYTNDESFQKEYSLLSSKQKANDQQFRVS